uniref:Guanine nucleotide binding protein (G protein), gamma 12 n=2 Tax=Pan TaxID=9596 RepID=K7C2C0_PANTR
MPLAFLRPRENHSTALSLVSSAFSFCDMPGSQINYRYLLRREEDFTSQRVRFEIYTKKTTLHLMLHLMRHSFFISLFFYSVSEH